MPPRAWATVAIASSSGVPTSATTGRCRSGRPGSRSSTATRRHRRRAGRRRPRRCRSTAGDGGDEAFELTHGQSLHPRGLAPDPIGHMILGEPSPDNRLGSSSVAVTELGFGGAGDRQPLPRRRRRAGGADHRRRRPGRRRLLRHRAYGLGLSERRFGAALAGHPDVVISTKVGRRLVDDPAGAGTTDLANGFDVPATYQRVWDFSADGIRRSLDDSLGPAGRDRLEIALIDARREPRTGGRAHRGVPGSRAVARPRTDRRDRRGLEGSDHPGPIRGRHRHRRGHGGGPLHPARATGPRRGAAGVPAPRHQRARRRRLQRDCSRSRRPTRPVHEYAAVPADVLAQAQAVRHGV